MAKRYDTTVPFQFEEYGQTTCEFNCRLCDLINPLLEAGLALCQLGELPAKDARFWEGMAYTLGEDHSLLNWRVNPRAGLPVWLTIVAQKTD